MPEFPEARIRTRSGLEWADQKTVQEAWSQAPLEVQDRFAGQVASVSDVDLVQVCADLVAEVGQLRAEAEPDWDNQDAPEPEGGHPPAEPRPRPRARKTASPDAG